jgi:hypothetical protein
MFKAALVGWIALLTLIVFPISVQGAINCENSYKSSLERLRRMHLPPERFVTFNRRALRIYDACETGDLVDPNSLFENLDRWKN